MGGKQSGYDADLIWSGVEGALRSKRRYGEEGNGHLLKMKQIMLDSAQHKPLFSFLGPRGLRINLISQASVSPLSHIADSRQRKSSCWSQY